MTIYRHMVIDESVHLLMAGGRNYLLPHHVHLSAYRSNKLCYRWPLFDLASRQSSVIAVLSPMAEITFLFVIVIQNGHAQVAL